MTLRPDGGTTATTYYDAARYIETSVKIDASQYLTSQQHYDGLGRVIKWITVNPQGDEGGNLVGERRYDGNGRLWKVANPYGAGSAQWQWTQYEYDALDRIIRTRYPDGSATETAYLGSRETLADQRGKKRAIYRDALQRPYRIQEDPGGANYDTYYEYDLLDNIVKVSQSSTQGAVVTQVREFLYDSLSRLIRETHPETGTAGANGVTTYRYDSNGNLVYRLDPRGVATNYVYDGRNRLKVKSYAGGPATPAVVYSYGMNLSDGLLFGRLREAYTTDGTGRLYTIQYSYDVMGRMAQKVLTGGRFPDLSLRSSYTYNYLGGVTEMQYPSGRVVRQGFDRSGRLRSVSSSRASSSSLGYFGSLRYWPAGALRAGVYGNALSFASTYNERLQPIHMTVPGKMDLWLNYTLVGPNNGNVDQVYDAVMAKDYRYNYDNLNRIQRAYGSGHPVWQDFSYDRWGNMVVGAVTESMQQYYRQGKNRLLNAGYDSAGNQTNEGTHVLAYDAENRIVSVDNGQTSYEYDAEGQRVRKSTAAGATYYFYGLGGEVLSELVADGSLLASRPQAPGTDVLTRYHHADFLGTPRVITDQSGGVVSRHDYYPFGGEIPVANQSDGESRKFTGKERDTETGLDYFGARYYSPAAGHFTSIDPSRLGVDPTNPQSWNRYTYALNNPLRFIDRNGLYNEDVHRDLTRVLALAAGFSESIATQIANADQGVDENQSTSALWGGEEARRNYHFTSSERRSSLYQIFNDTGSPDDLGIFLHAQQDSYSHEGYGPVRGHAAAGSQPDATYNNPSKANAMASDTYGVLVAVKFRLNVSNSLAPVNWNILAPKVRAFNEASTKKDKNKFLQELRDLINKHNEAQDGTSKKDKEVIP
jgi:RHS repeat-associated protein